MTDTKDDTPPLSPPPPARRTLLRTGAVAAALIAAFGAGAGLTGLGRAQDASLITPLQPTLIASLAEARAVAAQGDVAEIFGNKFILQDGSGRALIETGPEGEGGKLVVKGEHVTVQGRFDDGFLHAAILTHGDGKRIVIGPLGGPPGPPERTRDRLGFWPKPDVDGLTKRVEAAGYKDVRVTGRGPRHLEVVAQGSDGKDNSLHVDFDGGVREMDAFRGP